MTTLIFGIVVAFVTGYAAWSDFSEYQKRSRVGLIILSGLMLLGFTVQPKWWPSTSGKMALLTEGVDEELFSANEYDSVYSVRKEDKTNQNIYWVSDVSLLERRVLIGSKIDILGNGLQQELPKAFKWTNNLSKPEFGIEIHEAPKTIEIGRDFNFSIFISRAENGDSLAVFRDGVLWDRREINGNSHLIFEDRLTMEGPTSYVFELDGGDEVVQESWNVRAVKSRLLTVGTLLYSPSFEVNYLLEHLGERGHTVISRIRIGQNRFRYDAINAGQEEAEFIQNDLASVDILILDAREFEVLSNSEKFQLKEAISNGLDVILTPPSTENGESWSEVFTELAETEVEVEPLNRLEERNWIPGFFESERTFNTSLPLLDFRFVNAPVSGETLFKYIDNETVALRYQNGNGSISGHLFYRTYNWLIEGDKQSYNRFWIAYLNKAVELEGGSIEVLPDIPKIHREVKVYLTQPASINEVSVRSVFDADTMEIPITQQLQNGDVYTTSFWPRKTGWHVVQLGEQKEWFYVYSGNEWDFHDAKKKYLHTMRELDIVRSLEHNPVKETRSAVPNQVWLLAFLILQVTLWGERKIKG